MFKIPPMTTQKLINVIHKSPKAELHVHIEGTLEPELIFALAKRNQVQLPFESVAQLKAAYSFSDLQSFLDIYYAGASVLLHENDFFEMALAYFERAHADHIVHAEIFFDPQTHTERGVSMETVILGLHRACQEAKTKFNIDASLILCFLRHLSEESALETLELAMPFRDRFIGVGLDSSEIGNPPEKFKRVFAKARAAGLRCVAHAGEEAPAFYIQNAIEHLQIERIDHGVQITQNQNLMKEIADKRIPLTVCPLSNVKLKVFQNLADHNVRQLLDAGLCVTIHSDDPAYFGGYLNENFSQIFETKSLGLTANHAYQLLKNSFEASFITENQRHEWEHELKSVFSSAMEQDY